MRRLAGVTLFLCVAGLLLFWVLTRPATLTPETRALLQGHAADPARGERVFWAAGCASCHAAPGLDATSPTEDRLVLAGGHRFATPFGTFVAPNVSMHPVEGIGDWTSEAFAQSVLLGVSPDGGHYYPAFPFTSYARARPEDIADLWAFWQGLPSDSTPSQAHDLRFPFTLRRGLGLWKLVNFTTDYRVPQGSDPQFEHGRYLVDALGHCAECHTPRNQVGGLDRSQWLAGASNPAGEGRVPALPPEGWSADDIVAYLQSGFTPSFDVVGGAMADVVASMSRITPEDRAAIAHYLVTFRSLPNL